jgi:membrane protein
MNRLLESAKAWIERHRWARIARRSIGAFLEHEAMSYAGSMAYFSVLSLFQLLVLGVVVLSLFLDQGSARDLVVDQVSQNAPIDPELIGGVIDAVIASRGGITIFGFVFLAWGALGLFDAVSKGIRVAFPSAPPRGFVADKLLGLLLMGFTGVMAIASVAIQLATGFVLGATDDLVGALPGGGTLIWLIGLLVPFLLTLGALLVLYMVVPNRRMTWREALPGAVVGAVGWTVLRSGFTWYSTSIANYDSAFGPISTGVTLLVLLYFASVILLLGAHVARAVVVDREEQLRARAPASVAAAGLATPPPISAVPARRGRGVLGWLPVAGAVVAGIVLGRLSKREEE